MDSVLHSSSERPCAESFVSVNSMLSLSSRLSEENGPICNAFFMSQADLKLGSRVPRAVGSLSEQAS